MSDRSEAIFFDAFSDRIDERTIIFSEGEYGEITPPGHPKYDRHLTRISPRLAASSKRPTLGFADPRSLMNIRDQQEMINATRTVLDFGSRYIHHEKKITSMDEFREFMRSGDVVVLATPDHKVRAAARKLRRYNAAFDESHIRHVAKVKERFDRCLLIMGAAHAVSLHLKTNWQFEQCLDPQIGDVHSTFDAYVNSHLVPEQI